MRTPISLSVPPTGLRTARLTQAGFMVAWILLAIVITAPGLAQEAALPDGVTKTGVDVWSDGTRLSGDLFTPPGFSESDERGAIVLSHGWGGTRGHLNQAYAPFFAEAGFVVLTIDYRGWGDSDSRYVLRSEQPSLEKTGKVELEVVAIREEVDPLDQVEDIRNAITWIQGQPGVDPSRIGLWGSSYSGGHVIWVAAHDHRVKVTVSQVASMDSKGIIPTLPDSWDGLKAAAVARVRGDAAPYPDAEPRPGLTGTPDYISMAQYSPRDVAHMSRAASLIIDAENEELFDIREHGQAVHAILKNRVPVKYHVVPDIDHYGIYRDARGKAVEMAIDWYKKHL